MPLYLSFPLSFICFSHIWFIYEKYNNIYKIKYIHGREYTACALLRCVYVFVLFKDAVSWVCELHSVGK